MYTRYRIINCMRDMSYYFTFRFVQVSMLLDYIYLKHFYSVDREYKVVCIFYLVCIQTINLIYEQNLTKMNIIFLTIPFCELVGLSNTLENVLAFIPLCYRILQMYVLNNYL